jgi:hypothetical protein
MMHRRLPSDVVQTGFFGMKNSRPSKSVQLAAVIGSLIGSNKAEIIAAKFEDGAIVDDLRTM